VGKRKGRQRHTEFKDETLDEIARIARDPAISKAQRRKAQAEEKARGTRNRRKRKNR
jgi:hypothetical protein